MGTDGPAQGLRKPGFCSAEKQCYFHVVLLLKVWKRFKVKKKITQLPSAIIWTENKAEFAYA